MEKPLARGCIALCGRRKKRGDRRFQGMPRKCPADESDPEISLEVRSIGRLAAICSGRSRGGRGGQEGWARAESRAALGPFVRTNPVISRRRINPSEGKMLRIGRKYYRPYWPRSLTGAAFRAVTGRTVIPVLSVSRRSLNNGDDERYSVTTKICKDVRFRTRNERWSAAHVGTRAVGSRGVRATMRASATELGTARAPRNRRVRIP